MPVKSKKRAAPKGVSLEGIAAQAAVAAARQALTEFTALQTNRDDLALIVKNAVMDTVPHAVTAALTTFGFDTENPDLTRLDMAHTRRCREITETVRDSGLRKLVGYAITGVITLLIIAFSALVWKR